MATIFKKMYSNNYVLLIRGILLLAFSFSPYILEEHQITHTIVLIAFLIFSLGVIDIFEFITLEVGNISLRKAVYRNKKTLIKLFLSGFLGAVVLESAFQWLAKTWYYPFWTNTIYYLSLVLLFPLYFFTLLESYLAFKLLFDKLLKKKKYITKPYKFEPALFNIFGLVSLILIPIGIYILLFNYTDIGGYIFNISEKVPLNEFKVFIGVALFFLGLFLLLEFILYRKQKRTFFKTLIHGYWSPTLGTIFGSLFLLILMEVQNSGLLLWAYTNVPLEDIKLFSIPILGVIAWPTQYPPIINLYYLVFGDDEIHLLNGDRIE